MRTNLITGVADANMDRAPMLVLTGQGATARLHKESHQVMDVVAMFDPVTKWAETVRHPDTIPEIVRKAVRLARTEKPGAVLIELPEDVAKLETTRAHLPEPTLPALGGGREDRRPRLRAPPRRARPPSSWRATAASDGARASSCGSCARRRESA